MKNFRFLGISIGILLITLISLYSFADAKGYYKAVKANQEIIIDGIGNEAFWQKARWYPIDEVYLGEANANYSGRFKAAWKDNQIYLLIEITDNNLTNSLADGFESYWQGDCVEIFIDEAQYRADHQQNHNAFTYHLMNTGEVIDIDTDNVAKIFPDTAKFQIKKNSSKYTWEIALNVYSNEYNPSVKDNSKALVQLNAGKKLGFTVAYGDNNGEGREAFYGSTPGQGDTGYLTSEKFGVLELVK